MKVKLQPGRNVKFFCTTERNFHGARNLCKIYWVIFGNFPSTNGVNNV